MVKEKYKTNLLKTKYVNDSKITDHYAIIPTGQGFENYKSLDKLHKNIYELIVRRFLSIFFPPAEYNKVAVTIGIGSEEFFANGKVRKKSGYLDVMTIPKQIDETEKGSKQDNDEKTVKTKDEQENKDNIEIFSILKKGQIIEVADIYIKEGETTPPNRYSSGSMILAMENAGKLIEDEELREQIKGSGIGTSATRAEIIKKLQNIGYIEANNKTQILTSTKKGEYVYDIVQSSMPDLLNPKLTASWEKGLNMVAENEISADEFMKKLENYVRTKIVKFKKEVYGII